MGSRKAVGTAIALVSLLTGACGASASPAKPVPATTGKVPSKTSTPAAVPASKPLTPLTFQLEWRVSSQHVGFIVAKARGYYKQAGLNIKIIQGKGSGVTLDMVGAGDAPLGGSSAAVAALGITRGVPVKVIGSILQNSPSSFIYHKGLKFAIPGALRGRTLISAPGNVNIRLLPAVLTRYHTTIKALGARVDLLSPRAEYAAFLRNKNAVYLGYDTNGLTNIRAHDPTAQYKLYSSYGINVLGTSLIATDKEIATHPKVLREFMAASAKGWAYTVAHPRRAVAETVKLYPETSQKLVLGALLKSIPLLHTAASKGHPFGWMAKSDWQSTIALLHRYMGLKHPKPLNDYYTDQFISGGAS